MKLKIISLCFLISLTTFSYGQQLFESGTIYGGITGVGFTTMFSSGSITNNIKIPPNSSVKKAYFLATRNHSATNITVNLNGMNYTFSDSNAITKHFTSINHGSTLWDSSSIHLINITSDIDSSILNYTLITPAQTNSSNGYYSHYYLYIIYENYNLPKINYNLFINNSDVKPINNFILSKINPIETIKPISLSLLNYFFCDTTQDGSYISVNGSTLGLLGGNDANSSLWSCTGTYANFAHYNDSLFGLDDDTPDSLMSGSDVLADIKSYVNNGDTTVDVTFTYQSNFGPFSNPIAAIMLSYSTPCDTFSTSISTTNDTICPWGSTQLQATGGSKYNWFGAFGGLNDTSIANPIASPPQTITYICTITNDSGCVKTEQVKIWVDPCVGIDENNNNTPLIELYPNPTSSSFTITSNKTIENITINNIVGAIVYQQNNIVNNNLNLDLNLPNALYFISIETANGSVVKKLVVR